ncbi:14299_t:CDS:2 [Ambispora leptoticha]|uniref:14299_t:CDS:1 n=1 Tax=Ambispora leptoticha TaxID=144679 RepID=A0A9N9FPA2_9GLOM|nr:14299_t:CDS:2 [Ambispora leptoticha]
MAAISKKNLNVLFLVYICLVMMLVVSARALPLLTEKDSIEKRVDPNCSAFVTKTPNSKGGLKLFKKGDIITVTLLKGQSLVTKISDVELFNNKGLLSIVANGPWYFDKKGQVTIKFRLNPPTGNPSAKFGRGPTDDYKFMLRSWGSTDEGPSCTTFSDPFYIAN